MSKVCSKRGCENEKFGDNKYCILHCDKKDFNNQRDINIFWQKLREKYPYNWNNELIIENIKFPRFESYYYSAQRYFYNQNFETKLKFKKCIFFDDFDADSDKFYQGVSFDKCIFYGSISFQYTTLLELNNCEFKNEFRFENIDCRKLEIQNTKFINDCDIHIGYDMSIDEQSIFRNRVYLCGNGNNKLICNNSQFDKELQIDNIHEVEINNITLKSDVKFLTSSYDVFLKNTIFTKKVTFERLNNIKLDNVKINDLKFQLLENIEINESVFNKKITLNGNYNDITIKGSDFQGFDINTTNTIVLNDCKFVEIKFLGEDYQKVNFKKIIVENSLDIQNSQDIILNDIQANTVQMKGEKKGTVSLINFKTKKLFFSAKEYENIYLSKGEWYCDISLNSESIKNILFEKIKVNNLNAIVDHNKEFSLVSSKLKQIFIQNQVNRLIQFNDCICTYYIDIFLIDSKDIILNEMESDPSIKINSKSFSNIQINKSNLKNIFINAFNIIEKQEETIEGSEIEFKEVNIINNCLIYNVLSVKILETKVDNTLYSSAISDRLTITKSAFNQVDFKYSDINFLSIDSSIFSEDVLCSNSTINNVKITGKSKKAEFQGVVHFEHSIHSSIEIINSYFNQLDFKENSDSIIFSKIQNSQFDILNFHNNTVVNFLEESKDVKIHELTLDSVYINTFDNKSDIVIDQISIDSFTCKKLILKQDTNLDNMQIGKFRISNSNIEKVLRIRYSKIEEMFFVDTTFEDLQIIDNKNDLQDEKRGLRLKNTTIKSTVLDKLKLDNFNMSDAHVSDAKIGYVKFHQGSRETNRFFKNYYDSISDYIKANEYYKDEMEEQYKVSKWPESVILFCNKHISDFGQSWIKPLGWILFFSIVFYSIINFKYFMIDGYILNHKWYIWNSFWQFLNPFSKNASQEYMDWYWLWMTHKLLLTAFIYHFVIAVKRRTKR